MFSRCALAWRRRRIQKVGNSIWNFIKLPVQWQSSSCRTTADVITRDTVEDSCHTSHGDGLYKAGSQPAIALQVYNVLQVTALFLLLLSAVTFGAILVNIVTTVAVFPGTVSPVATVNVSIDVATVCVAAITRNCYSCSYCYI